MGAFDYVAVGHVTIDVLHHGSAEEVRRPGGSAFYSGLQAARLGLRTLLITQGDPPQIEALLQPYASELELRVAPAACTTTLHTLGSTSQRMQRLCAWAGPIDSEEVRAASEILHLAPVAHETPSRWPARARFVGLTPQGLIRRWPPGGGQIELVALEEADMPQFCDAIVISETERAPCDALLRRIAPAAVTAGEQPTEVHLSDGSVASVAPLPATRSQDDIGAGDVFAAAFFIALLEGLQPPRAAAFGNAAAAVRIGGDGAGAIGDRDAIQRALDANMG